jgi:hypothetical protein
MCRGARKAKPKVNTVQPLQELWNLQHVNSKKVRVKQQVIIVLVHEKWDSR